jgi:hypothetical protein
MAENRDIDRKAAALGGFFDFRLVPALPAGNAVNGWVDTRRLR